MRFVIIFSLFFIVSCKKSNDAAPAPVHSFTFKGKTYDIKDAAIKYWEPADLVRDDGDASPTHNQTWILFSDGQITLKGSSFSASNATYIVPMAVFTTMAGNDGTLKGGTLPSVLPQDFNAGKGLANKDFFTGFLFRFDKNNDSTFDQDDLWVDANDGSFKVTVVDSNFKLEFNVTTTSSSAGTSQLPENVGLPIVGKYEGELRVLTP